jgi:transglutaminase-like putative cysteine protease
MPNRLLPISLLFCLAMIAGCGDEPRIPAGNIAPATQPARDSATGRSRAFTLQYVATIPNVPAGAHRVEMWVPIPSSDAQQTISQISVDTPLAHEFQTENEYGNRLLHVWSDQQGSAWAMVTFDCVRLEEHAAGGEAGANVSTGPAPSSRLLQPDRLGIIDDSIRKLAAQITAYAPDTQSKARAIYDYVIAHMAYDKVAPGWGNGDTARACEVGKGNCTDFHALFISLARASGIPARFGIGFQIPPSQSQGAIAGYHCWAEFWLPNTGWVPVDASEAWKDPSRRDFYFKSLDPDRIRMSLGRDIHLPGMAGEPVNYLLSPYAEADGKPVKTERKVMLRSGQ